MKEELITKAYEVAKERYAAIGVDVDAVIKQMQDFHLSLHCWQADDVMGFEKQAGPLTGGIQTTGNYPGRARNIDELRQDILKACSLIPGTHRLNLHEIYGDFQGKIVDRNEVDVTYFQSWIDWGKEHNMKLDFNSTSFSHPKSGDLTLSNPDEGIRNFWIEHTMRCREIAEAMGKAQGDPCIMNIWLHDGSKDITVFRYKYRSLFKDSLDKIFAVKYDNMKDCLESKTFGIGLESFTSGSLEFCVGYCAQNNKIYTIDTGHYHPTESISDKIPAMLCFFDKVPLHVTRPVRWDSDHVVLFDDETKEIMKEVVRNNALDKVLIGLDFFDASINRIAAWVVGCRSAQKSLLFALLQPNERLRQLQDKAEFTEKMVLMETAKTLPFGEVWQEYCRRQGVPQDGQWLEGVRHYEQQILKERG